MVPSGMIAIAELLTWVGLAVLLLNLLIIVLQAIGGTA